MENIMTSLTAALSLFVVLVDGTTVSLKATPASIEPLVTKVLTLVCQLSDAPSEDTDLSFASAMTITHDGKNIAMITAHSPATKIGNFTGVVSGQFNGKAKDGHVQITWQYPDNGQAGQYACLVAGMARKGHGTTVNKQLRIEREGVDAQDLVNHIHDLQAAVDKLIETNARQNQKIVDQDKQIAKQDKQIAKQDKQIAKQDKQNANQDKQIAKQGKQIAFTASLNKYTKVNTDQTVKYNHVLINIGNGYNPNTGEFTVPVAGMYKVDVSARNYGKDTYATLRLIHNGKYVFALYADDSEYNSASNSAVIHLNQGEVVKVVAWFPSELYGAPKTVFNTFSGFLLALD